MGAALQLILILIIVIIALAVMAALRSDSFCAKCSMQEVILGGNRASDANPLGFREAKYSNGICEVKGSGSEPLVRTKCAGGAKTKLEMRIVKLLEDITGHKFPTAHPVWLDGLELDGYNDELKIALEVQGPGHYKPLPRETNEAFEERVRRDRFKVERCAKRGVKLIVIDYNISPLSISDYLRSRLFDIEYLTEKPANYIKKIGIAPYARIK